MGGTLVDFDGSGIALWPLDHVVADMQYHVRDPVIDYVMAIGTDSMQVEGRLALQ